MRDSNGTALLLEAYAAPTLLLMVRSFVCFFFKIHGPAIVSKPPHVRLKPLVNQIEQMLEEPEYENAQVGLPV